MTPAPDHGYWLAGADGGVFAFGGAPFEGSMGATALAEPIVGMASTPDGRGYWLVASDGGVFSFGDAPFEGSMGATHLAKPIVGMAPTPDGAGYWLVASDGGVFSFGDAGFYGSLGRIRGRPRRRHGAERRRPRLLAGGVRRRGLRLRRRRLPRVDGGQHLARPWWGFPHPGRRRLLAGGVRRRGLRLRRPLRRIDGRGAARRTGRVAVAPRPEVAGGYWEVAADGGVFAFGGAPFDGSAGGLRLAAPVVALAPAG